MALGSVSNREVKERIVENIFKPLLNNNKTVIESEDSEEYMQKREEHHRKVDGGKLPPKV
jgi:AAA+ superfamily predicted ATPase